MTDTMDLGRRKSKAEWGKLLDMDWDMPCDGMNTALRYDGSTSFPDEWKGMPPEFFMIGSVHDKEFGRRIDKMQTVNLSKPFEEDMVFLSVACFRENRRRNREACSQRDIKDAFLTAIKNRGIDANTYEGKEYMGRVWSVHMFTLSWGDEE